MEYKYIVESEGVRLDKYLGEKNADLSRTMIQKLIEKGGIQVNGLNTKTSYKVNEKDIITISVEPPKESETLKAEDLPINVIYEDNDILVINKEKGMVVHPGNGNLNGTLANAVLKHCKESLSGIGGEIRPGIVHRLDKDTSGLIIVAKHDKAHIALSEDLKEHKVKKTYIAVVRGIVKENEATIDMPIARSESVRTKMAVRANGKNAVTHFKVLYRAKDYTVLEINIETGRTHQIRVHMAEIGYPIVGDGTYSNGKNTLNVKGQMLHAWKLEFIHPITKKDMSFTAELPKYFEEILDDMGYAEWKK